MIGSHVIIFIASLAIAHTAYGGVMPIRTCPGVSPVGELVHLIVPSCSKPPCVLRKGQNYDVEIDFELAKGKGTEGLEVIVTGIIGGIELPWNGVGRAGCNDMLVGRCPLEEEAYVTYGVNLAVLAMYPSVNLDIKWRMKDDRGEDIWCFLLAASITN